MITEQCSWQCSDLATLLLKDAAWADELVKLMAGVSSCKVSVDSRAFCRSSANLVLGCAHEAGSLIALLAQCVFWKCSEPRYQFAADGNWEVSFCPESCWLCAVSAAWPTPVSWFNPTKWEKIDKKKWRRGFNEPNWLLEMYVGQSYCEMKG